MSQASESTISNWSCIEDQLTKKLNQLTMLLHHFANSTNEEETQEVRNIYIIDYLIQNCTC